jgi:hypothetical protein
VSLDDRRGRLRLLAFPRGRSEARPYGTDRVMSEERSGRRWRLRLTGAQRRRWEVEATVKSLQRPFRPCAVRAGRRRVRFAYERGVIRFAVRARRATVVVRGRC